MAFYRICPDCGAYLDPGERCNCHEERLIEMATEIYFETEHDKGWPALLCAPLRSRMRNCSTG